MKSLIALLLFASAAFAQPRPGDPFVDPDYERVLIPVFFSGPGANGAQWETAIDVNASVQEVRLAEPALIYTSESQCNGVPCSCASTLLEARRSARLCSGLEHAAGLLLWVPRTARPKDLNFSVRVRDTSKNATSAGTYVPVVWERELSAEPMVLLDVPVDSRFRSSLRIYDAFGFPYEVIVKIYDMAEYRGRGAQPLVVTGVDLADPNPAGFTRFIRRPAFTMIGDLVAAYPQLAGHSSVAIEVQGTQPRVSPPLPTDRFYALASVTNNTTQEVTIIAPR